MDNGLPGQNVKQVYQDSKGIIWMLIEATGLCRYDGRNFEVFSQDSENPTSISNNYVTMMVEDSEDNLWIGTENGLNKYIRNENLFKTYLVDSNQKNGLSSNIILSLFIDNNDVLWVGTDNGLLKYNKDTDTFEQIKLISNEKNLWINTIIQHTSGNYFIGTNQGLILYNPISDSLQQWLPQTKNGIGLSHEYIRGIVEDYEGNLWIATHKGVCKFDMNTKQFKPWGYLKTEVAIFEDEGYNMVFTADKKNIWLASYANGIIIINSETNTYQRLTTELNTEKSLKSNHIYNIYKDRSGLIWISTKFEGAFIYDRRKENFNQLPEKYQVFKAFKGLHTISFSNDLQKDIFWVGTKFNGLFKIDIRKETITNYKHNTRDPQSISGDRVLQIFCDNNDDLWICSGNGVDFLSKNSSQFEHYSNSLGNCAIEDLYHTIWVGTNKGIYIANKNTNTLQRYLKNNHPFFSSEALDILYLYIDKQNQIWFGTRYNGLFRYNVENNIVTHFNSQHPKIKFLSDGIRVITEDELGNIWFGTKSDGICVFNPLNDSIRYLTTKDGLGSNYILSIQQDLHHNFWIGTHNGLTKYDSKNTKFTNYTMAHGLQGNIFEFGANAIFDDGNLIFGGHNGINIFNPNSINSPNTHNNDSLLITSIKIFNKEILRDVSSNTDIQLNYQQNYISLEFILTNMVDPLNHTFKYRIKEINDNWHDLGNKNYVALSNLHPGRYHFELMGTNEFGLETKNSLILNIEIIPPVWQTWWFKSIALTFFGMIIFFSFWIKIRNDRKIRLYLESEISQRTESIREANEALTSQNHLIEKQKNEIERNQNILELKVVERTKELELAKQKAEESDKLKTAFLANMSHEIRTPLNAIIGFSSIIVEESEDNEDLIAYGNHIKQSGDMLIKLVDDILDISKLEVGQIKIKNSDINLNKFLNSILETFNYELEIKQKYNEVKLILTIPENEEKTVIISDNIRLKQILFNLLSNAIKFTEKGSIEFGYHIKLGIIEFFVKDTGSGINENELSTIFNRFVKLENKDSMHRGSGLGLAICKSLTQLLGGNIWVKSIKDQGSTFFFTIPLNLSIRNNS
jgi:signal transduction histidine kinase/ligand-binding sensor domain-containing protein